MPTLQDARHKLRDYQPVEISFEHGMIAAAVAVMLHDGAAEGGLEALFIHRAVRVGDTWSGQIAFPGPVNPARILACELAAGALADYRGVISAEASPAT